MNLKRSHSKVHIQFIQVDSYTKCALPKQSQQLNANILWIMIWITDIFHFPILLLHIQWQITQRQRQGCVFKQTYAM